MIDQLTDRQAALFDWIRQEIDRERRPPTVREIADQFGILSPNGVVCHLKALERKGLLERRPGARNIRILYQQSEG